MLGSEGSVATPKRVACDDGCLSDSVIEVVEFRLYDKEPDKHTEPHQMMGLKSYCGCSCGLNPPVLPELVYVPIARNYSYMTAGYSWMVTFDLLEFRPFSYDESASCWVYYATRENVSEFVSYQYIDVLDPKVPLTSLGGVRPASVMTSTPLDIDMILDTRISSVTTDISGTFSSWVSTTDPSSVYVDDSTTTYTYGPSIPITSSPTPGLSPVIAPEKTKPSTKSRFGRRWSEGPGKYFG